MSGSTIAPPTHCRPNIWKFPLMHVRIHRRELVGADVEVDTDVAQLLLDDGRLQTDFLGVAHLQRQTQAGKRTVAVGILVAGLIEQLPRAIRIVGELKDIRVRTPRPATESGRSRDAQDRGADIRRSRGDRSRSRWRGARACPPGSGRAC